MATRSKSQQIGSLGQQIVKLQLELSGMWIARSQDEDFGIDLEMELTVPDVSGKIIKVQVKSHQAIPCETDFLTERVSKRFLRYVNECKIPILLVVVNTNTSETWFTWLQKWLHETKNRTNIYNESKSASFEIRIPKNSGFDFHLKTEIVKIATWQNNTQKLITLHDLAKLSLELYDDKLAEILFAYIESLEQEQFFEHPDEIINRVMELGATIWATHEGNKRSQQLFHFIRTNGHKLTREHIAKLVLRDDSHSRTGINALGILYNEFPNHALGLKLPEFFKGVNDAVHYYCVLKERNLDKKGFAWIMEVNDLRVGDFIIRDDRFLNDIFDKMANRGDSAILDYVEYLPLSEV